MKPFDLEAAKRGEPIVLVTRDGREAFFVGICKGERPIVVCDSAGNLTRLLPDGYYTTNGAHINDIFMEPKKRTVWVNFYPSVDNEPPLAMVHKSQKKANKDGLSHRIGGKAYPVEIEE